MPIGLLRRHVLRSFLVMYPGHVSNACKPLVHTLSSRNLIHKNLPIIRGTRCNWTFNVDVNQNFVVFLGEKLLVVTEFVISGTQSVADPGFPRGGGTSHKGGATNLLFWSIFPPNCMKIGPRRGGVPGAPWIRQCHTCNRMAHSISMQFSIFRSLFVAI